MPTSPGTGSPEGVDVSTARWCAAGRLDRVVRLQTIQPTTFTGVNCNQLKGQQLLSRAPPETLDS
jgi:hypothetical protein